MAASGEASTRSTTRNMRIGPWPSFEHASELDGQRHVRDLEVVARPGMNANSYSNVNVHRRNRDTEDARAASG